MISLILIYVIFSIITITIIVGERITKKKKKLVMTGCIFLLVLFTIFFPTPTPGIAAKRYLFLNHPFEYFTLEVQEGIKNQYIVRDIDRSFIYVSKTKLGWQVESSGHAP